MYLYLPILNKKINFNKDSELYVFMNKCKRKAYSCGLLSLRAGYKPDKIYFENNSSDSIQYNISDFDKTIQEEMDKGRKDADIKMNWICLPYALFKNWYYKSVLSIYRSKFKKHLEERESENTARRKESITNIEFNFESRIPEKLITRTSLKNLINGELDNDNKI